MMIALITSKYSRLNETFIQREINGLKKAGAKINLFQPYNVDKASFSNKNVLSTFENEQVKWCKIVDCRFLPLRYFSGFLKFLKRVSYAYEILKIILAYYKSVFIDLLKFLCRLPKILYWDDVIKENSQVLSFRGNYPATASCCHTLVHASTYIADAVPTVIKGVMSLSRAVIADVAGIPELVRND